MARKNQVFNSVKRKKLLRQQISVREAAAGALCLVALLVAGLWLSAQKNRYDPSERDISLAVLKADSVEDTLYKTPLKAWRDPALGAETDKVIDLGLFPPTLVGGEWRAGSRVQAFTPQTLYEKINGQAEQYLKFGCQSLHCVTLEHVPSSVEIDLYLYDQGTFANCLGLYQEQRSSSPLELLDGLSYTPTKLGAYGMVGRFFFQVIGDEGAEELVLQKTRQVLGELASLAESEPLPEPFHLLRDGLGLPVGGIAYVPANAFQYGFAQRFWFGAENVGSDARYYLQRSESAEAAEALFNRLHEAQRQVQFEILQQGAKRVLYQHEYLGHFSMRRTGDTLYGVQGFPDAEAARVATDRLEDLLVDSGATEGEPQ